MKDTRHPSFMCRISTIILLLTGLCTGPALLASPHVKIATIWAYGDTVTHARTLDTKQNNLRFYCTTLENIPTDSIEFEFMLEGHETQWQPAFADGWYFYTDLPPGEYVFHARCRYPPPVVGTGSQPFLHHSLPMVAHEMGLLPVCHLRPQSSDVHIPSHKGKNQIAQPASDKTRRESVPQPVCDTGQPRFPYPPYRNPIHH